MREITPFAPLLLALATTAGCAFEPGHGFATLEEAEVSAVLEPAPDRDLGDHTLLTDAGYHVRLETATLETHALVLETAEGEEPPPDDDGHAHGLSVDGARAALTDEGFVPVATVEVDRPLDLRSGEAVTSRHVDPSAELPETHIERLHVELGHLHLEGTITHPDPAVLGGETVALRVDLAPGALVAPLDREVGRDGPAVLTLTVHVHVEAPPFDGLDFAGAAVDGEIVVASADDPLADPIVEAVLASHVDAHLEPPEEHAP